MLRLLIGAFLLIHGLISAAQAPALLGSGEPPENPSWMSWWPTPLGRPWLLTPLGLESTLISWLFGILWVVAGVCFVASGVGIFAHQEWWQAVAAAGALISLVVLAVYFHPWYAFAVLLNAGILLALWWTHWPTNAVGS